MFRDQNSSSKISFRFEFMKKKKNIFSSSERFKKMAMQSVILFYKKRFSLYI